MRTICVFCGSNAGARPEYLSAVDDLASGLAGRGLRVVYGGAVVGAMGALADAAMRAGGEVIGVIPRRWSRPRSPMPGSPNCAWWPRGTSAKR